MAETETLPMNAEQQILNGMAIGLIAAFPLVLYAVTREVIIPVIQDFIAWIKWLVYGPVQFKDLIDPELKKVFR